MTIESPGCGVSDDEKQELFRRKVRKQMELQEQGEGEWEKGIVHDGMEMETERMRYEVAMEEERKKEEREAQEERQSKSSLQVHRSRTSFECYPPLEHGSILRS